MLNTLLRILCCITLFLSFTATYAQTIVYVTPTGAGTKSGTSWANAYDATAFAQNLGSAVSGTSFWVASGTYMPVYAMNQTVPTDPRSAIFYVPSGVSVYGGFNGTETSLSQRIYKTNKTITTILSGDIGVPGVYTDDCYTVAMIFDGGIATNIFDGITIAYGYGATPNTTPSSGGGAFGAGLLVTGSNSVAATISNCIFTNNYSTQFGGGVAVIGWDFNVPAGVNKVYIDNCFFINNTCGSEGGGIKVDWLNVDVSNSVFANNTVSYGGAGMDGYKANDTLINCTFYNNVVSSDVSDYAAYQGGAAFLGNCIFANGTGPAGPISTNYTTVQYSAVQTGWTGTGDITFTGTFTNPTNLPGGDGILGTVDDGLELVKGSATINAGDNVLILPSITTDITDATPRIKYVTVDIGAYEFFCDSTRDSITTSTCAGKPYMLNGQAYSTTGTYYQTLTNKAGCDSILKLILSVNPPTTSVYNAHTCSNQPYVFNGKTFNPVTGIYYDTITNAKDCDSIITLNLTVTYTTFADVSKTICTGQTYTLPNNKLVTTSGTYIDTILNHFGCDSIVTTILYVAKHGAAVSPVDTTVCPGTTVPLYVTDSGFITSSIWNPATGIDYDDIQTPIATVTQPATYTVTVITSYGCIDTAMVTIDTFPLPVVSITASITIPEGSSIPLMAGGGVSYKWTPSNTLSDANIYDPVATPTQNTKYTVSVFSQNGCKVESSVTITLNDSGFVLVPNAFSPNGDGVNDFLSIIARGNFRLNYFNIYNRWGQLIYSTQNLTSPWDGKFQGQPEPVGSYVYLLQGTANEGTIIQKQGSITLLR